MSRAIVACSHSAVCETRRSTLARLNLPDRHKSLKLKVSFVSYQSKSYFS